MHALRPALAIIAFPIIVALILSCAGNCCADEVAADNVVIGGPTMGTTYHIRLAGADKADEPALRAAIDTVLDDVDRRLSTYRKDSEISRFNRAPAGEWFTVSPATVDIVAAAIKLNRETRGALDVTVGPLVRLWHFGPDAIAAARSPADLVPPDEASIEAARKRIGCEKLEVRTDPPALRKLAGGLEIDLSAVGEGYAIDLLAEALERHNCHHYLIELGGEVRASGNRADGTPWRVAIARPSPDRTEIESVVPISGASLATSGDYRRYFEFKGRRYSHIIDPTTGAPIDHALAAVTVVADDSFTADVWDTALLVLGPERGFDLAVEQNLAALFISRAGNDYSARETPAWRERFSIVGDQ